MHRDTERDATSEEDEKPRSQRQEDVATIAARYEKSLHLTLLASAPQLEKKSLQKQIP
jgi:hypothetical protein